MPQSFWWATGGLGGLLLLVIMASYYGWGFAPEAQVGLWQPSVRTGSMHMRAFESGGIGSRGGK